MKTSYMNILWRIAHKFYIQGGIFCSFGRIFELLHYIIGSNAISARAEIGERTAFFHRGVGCVIHPRTKIGNDCKIFANVTMGSKWKEGICKNDAPIIGDRVIIGANVVILGDILIGNDVIIGAGSVVLDNIPDDCIAVGNPAIIKKREKK